MKIVIFGLTMTSSWGNGHATLWRGLCQALARRGHSIVFFERDVPYYANQRDLWVLHGCWLHLYSAWSDCAAAAQREAGNADVAMVTSFCPDGRSASEVVLSSTARLRAFYDMDAPVTLHALDMGEPVFYLPDNDLKDFDLVFSYTGGKTLEQALKTRLGARRVVPLYGSVDPEAHRPVRPANAYQCDLSYLGTYAADRQPAVNALFMDPAWLLPRRQFLLAGAMYPPDLGFARNVRLIEHLPPPEHPAFYSSSRLTLNVTRRTMKQMGHCPSGRLFEAAACATPVLSDWWEGLDQFYTPGSEILIARTTHEAVEAIEMPDAELVRIGRAARERTLEEHTAERRAIAFEEAVESACERQPVAGLKELSAPGR